MPEVKNTDRIRKELQKIFTEAQSNGLSSIKVVASELHDRVAFKPKSHHNQMPSCCNMMTEAKSVGDAVLYSPPKGRGGRLSIRYKIPR